MTTITNMVVALMIVTTGEEPVLAYPEIEIKKPAPYGGLVMPCADDYISKALFDTVVVGPSNERETLYRKTCKTNFVYSAKIDTPICVMCPAPLCQRERKFTVEDLFGCQVQSFWVHCDANLYCEEHKYLRYVKERR